MVRVDYVTGTPVAGLQVLCYEAATADALALDFLAKTVASRTAGTLQLYDQLTAGSGTGARFMGMVVLAPPGSFPGTAVDAPALAGFGFPLGSPVLVLGANLVFSAAIQAAAPANDPSLDAGTDTALFALGTGADLGKLKYIGPRDVAAQIIVGVDASDPSPGPDEATISLLVDGAVVAAAHQRETGGNSSVNQVMAKTVVLTPGALIDVSSDVNLAVERYHVNALATILP